MSARRSKIDNDYFDGVTGLVCYFGIGALLHAVFVGAQFDWSSAWTWGWLLGWPIMFVLAFSAFFLAIFATGIVAAIVIVIGESVNAWRAKKRRRPTQIRRRPRSGTAF